MSVESFAAEGKSGLANAEHFLDRVDSVGWDAQLAVDEYVPHLKSYYHEMEHWGWHDSIWGGVFPIYWQCTWKGHVGGLNVDCDACRLSPKEHKDLWQRVA